MTSLPPSSGPSALSSLLDLYQQERKRLRGLAYRLLGSLSDAEDVLQDVWLRWSGVAAETVQSPAALLTTITTRLCLDRLRTRQRMATDYVGCWLPEPDLAPLPPLTGTVPDSPEQRREDLSYAFLIVLERLSPEQRVAFLLHDILDMDYPEIAEILQASQAACRQMVHRARQRVGREPPSVSAERARTISGLAQAFAHAVDTADYDGLVRLFTSDAILLSDGGGKIKAAINPILGADAISRFFLGISRKRGPGIRVVPCLINGVPGAIVTSPGRTDVLGFMTRGSRLHAVYMISNPDKLGDVDSFLRQLIAEPPAEAPYPFG